MTAPLSRTKKARFKKIIHSLDSKHPFLFADYRENGPLSPPGDMHFSPQILIVLSGTLTMHYRSGSITCRSGEFCLTGPWEPHRAVIGPGKIHYLVITIDLAMLGTVSPFHDVDWIHPFLLSLEKRPTLTTRRERASILLAARELLWKARNDFRGYQSLFWLEIHHFLWYIQARCPQDPNCSSKSFRKIYPAIALAQNMVERAVPLDEAAAACGLSKSRFAAMFKQETGYSFCDFAIRVRIHAAAHALDGSSGDSAKQIAADFGFSDVSHFYRVFRKIFGCTPIEYTKRKGNF